VDIGSQGAKTTVDISVQKDHFQNAFIFATRPVGSGGNQPPFSTNYVEPGPIAAGGSGVLTKKKKKRQQQQLQQQQKQLQQADLPAVVVWVAEADGSAEDGSGSGGGGGGVD
jgi:hypothetical protein